MGLIEIFVAGGPVMWPLLACSVIAVAIIIERALMLRTARVLPPALVEWISGLIAGGSVDKALDECKKTPGIFTAIIGAGLEAAESGDDAARTKEAIEDAGRHETARLNRYLGTLGTIVGISPLLGLLGTVTGMIEVFDTIAEVGAGQAAALSSGISQALITTATGLLIAIPSLVAYNFFNEKAQVIVTDLERASLRVLHGVFRGERDETAEVAGRPSAMGG